jgi:uncharacterized protein DUF547
MRRFLALLMLAALPFGAFAFDHGYAAWEDLLRKHVRYIENGNASRVSYAGFLRDRGALHGFLREVQDVKRAEFDAWTKPEQEAFLINAYNAFTVEKILTRYPDLKSIRDFGTLFGNPWKDKFFTLFGRPAYLDMIEHEMLRKEGVYDEPRVHVAVVCASIGCPMLRNEAFRADTLDEQLEDAMRRFLSDRTRNRYSSSRHRLEVSRIFEWYGSDFEKGYHGFATLKGTFARYADLLAYGPEFRQAVRQQKADVVFLEYDWGLNDARE